MAYLVRKLIKRDKLSGLKTDGDIGEIWADIPTTEFRTTNGSLSTWKIETFEDLDKAVLAIAVSSSEISKMDFIVLDVELIERYDLSYESTYAGVDIPVPDLQDTHCDIIGITMDKLRNCACLYGDIWKNEPDEGKYIIRYTIGDIKKLIKDAIANGKVDKTKASGKIAEVIEKLSVQNASA